MDRHWSLGEAYVILPSHVNTAIDALYLASSLEAVEYYAGLYGSYSSDGTLVTIAGLVSVRSGGATGCERDVPSLTKSLRRLWEMTAGKQYYIGDWHTHPNASSDPSEVDLATLASDDCEQCKQPLLLISGCDGYSLRGMVCGEILAGES